jgi:hypothetical protein
MAAFGRALFLSTLHTDYNIRVLLIRYGVAQWSAARVRALLVYGSHDSCRNVLRSRELHVRVVLRVVCV